MEWTEIQIKIPVEQVDTAAAIAQMVVPYGLYIEDYTDLERQVEEIAHINLIDEELLARDRTVGIVHLYISPDQNPAEALSFLSHRLGEEGIEFSLNTEGVSEEDWATAWKAYYHPVKIGSRVVVCPSWEDYTPAQGELVIRLDPGMAFGTGTHHTTQLCIELLEEVIRPGAQVLDMGCGSGILSFAAVRLGAQRALGVDVDPTAVRIAMENAQMVGLREEEFSAICGDLVHDTALAQKVGLGCYDVIAANIVADVIIYLAPSFLRHLKAGGVLVASGIITERLDEVLAALDANGMQAQRVLERGGWAAAVLGAKE